MLQNDVQEPLIDLRKVEMQFGSGAEKITALSESNLEIENGSFVVLLGPSGCGKTTLLRIILGLQKPTRGEITISGKSVWVNNRLNPAAVSETGIVFQEANLFPWYSILDNIALPLRIKGMGRKARTERARELMELVGISGFENRWPRELSGGMRQRAAIARALSYDPEVLLMDEPFGALDAMTRDNLNLELQKIWLKTKKTIVLVTHSISEAVFLADKIVLLSPRPGKIDLVVDVPFPRSRQIDLQSTHEFQEIVLMLRNRLLEMK